MKDVCTLCDKPMLENDLIVMGAQSGQMLHGNCYKIYLIGKMRGDI